MSVKLMAVSILTIFVTGCAKEVTGTTAQMCGDWRPVSISKHDKLTDQTASEISGNNAARTVWCTPAKV